MKKVTGWIATNKIGSECEFEFEVEDDATDEEIEREARDSAFDLIDWSYRVDGKEPS
jgi:hypothetical protein